MQLDDLLACRLVQPLGMSRLDRRRATRSDGSPPGRDNRGASSRERSWSRHRHDPGGQSSRDDPVLAPPSGVWDVGGHPQRPVVCNAAGADIGDQAASSARGGTDSLEASMKSSAPLVSTAHIRAASRFRKIARMTPRLPLSLQTSSPSLKPLIPISNPSLNQAPLQDGFRVAMLYDRLTM